MTTTHLAPLIGREAPLPPRLADKRAQWHAASDRLAERLTDALSAETAPSGIDLSLKSESQVRTRTDVVVIQLSDGYAAISNGDTAVLANRLLRVEENDDAGVEASTDAPALRALDILLMAGIAGEIVAAVAEAFGTELTHYGKPRPGWPPVSGGTSGAGAGDTYLCAALSFETSGRRVTLRLFLEGPPGAYAAPTPALPSPCPRMADAAREAQAPLSAVLDSWTVTASEAARLATGTVLPLNGASVEALDVVLDLPGGPMRLASAELGKSRGRQAIRLTSGLSFG